MKRLLLSGLLLGCVGAAWACSGGDAASPSAGDAGSPGDDGGGGGDDGGATPEAASDAPPGMQTVTFAYAPQWDGVTKVEVVGGFGQPSDWSKTQALLALTKDASGRYTGTAELPAGTYLYVFRVTGDAQAATPASYVRYAVDPLQPAFAACPMESPTYSKVDPNPCSQLVVPQVAPATPVHVKGTLAADGAPAAGWMVWLERDEPQSHHFFANRVTTGADGTFDLVGSTGRYRLQVQHPTLLSETDLQRDPTQLAALRRAISGAFALASTDVTIASPDLAFHDYAQFAPTGDAGALPTSFHFETGVDARLTIYGGPGDGGVVDIGDPWFASGFTSDGGASFDGVFDTKQAMQDAAAPGTRYMWGTEENFGSDASVPWTKQTMVFPVVWP